MQLTSIEHTRALHEYPTYWAECFGRAPMLPISRTEMDELGWDSCDIIIVTGDAYVDHPSFGMAICGRLLEAHGFRVGIIAQPDWQSAEPFAALGAPNLFFGVTAGNMDSMINRYTADRKIRSDDAYSPNDVGGKRPDRASAVYSHRCREAYPNVPIVLGGIEGSLRRIAHYDYWQDKVRRSIMADAKADILVYGNGERAIVDIAHRLAAGNAIDSLVDIRGTAYFVDDLPANWTIIDSSKVDKPGRIEQPTNPYAMVEDNTSADCNEGINATTYTQTAAANSAGKSTVSNSGKYISNSNGAKNKDLISDKPANQSDSSVVKFVPPQLRRQLYADERATTVLRLPSYEMVKNDPALYAHANRVLHLETNPGNARALVQNQGGRKLWINPPPVPLTTEEMDFVFDQPFARVPHPSYNGARIPAYEMIRFSVNIMRGCFGGCTFCSITEHEGRKIQNRSEDSIIREIETMRDSVPGFTGVVSDLGGPTANMYRLACKSKDIESNCRLPSCVYPSICKNLNTDHSPLIKLYKRARELPGVKKVLIASGLRYDLAVESPEYVEELVTHHVGGYLKIAPEHTESAALDKMMKPGIGAYDEFKRLFEKFSKKAGKQQYLIPYFIAAHPGTRDEDMMNLALWLKRNDFRADQVQNFYPSPMATATTMYYTGKNPLKRIRSKSGEEVFVAKTGRQRRLHKAFLRYHDPNNWPLLRDALKDMGRADLIGNGDHQLIPKYQPRTDGSYQSARRKNSTASGATPRRHKKRPTKPLLTQHTGLPPRKHK